MKKGERGEGREARGKRTEDRRKKVEDRRKKVEEIIGERLGARGQRKKQGIDKWVKRVLRI